jgi:hypothetical protein
MHEPSEKDITRRAYELWERAGCPEGRDKEFYRQAEEELRQTEARIRLPNAQNCPQTCEKH